MIDRLRELAIFAKTIDHGSFRGAARALRLSPSVVSHHISQLEEALGVALIYRSTRKLSLTREGERLLVATRQMIEAVEGELTDLSTTATAPSGELRLTLPSVLSQSHLTDQIAAFAAAHPRIKLSLDFSDTRRALIEDGFDCAIRMGPKLKPGPSTRKLFEVKRKLVASHAYLAGRSKARVPKDLLNWDWLMLTPAVNIPLEFKKSGERSVTIRPNAQVYTNDAQALYRLARANAGLAIVPEFLAERDVADGGMVYLLPDWDLPPVQVYAAWHVNAPKHGLIHLLLNGLTAF